jgi:hypothetical protein
MQCRAKAHQALLRSCAGYGGKVAAEIGKLKAMAQRGQDRAQLGALLGLVAERATVAVAQQPERATPKVRAPMRAIYICLVLPCMACRNLPYALACRACAAVWPNPQEAFHAWDVRLHLVPRRQGC